MIRSPYAQRWRSMQKRRPRRTLSVALLETSQRMALEDRKAMRTANRRVTWSPGPAVGEPLNWAGVTLQKGGTKIMDLFKSRKFWASVAGLLLVVIQQFVPDFPLDNAQMTNVILVIVAYVIGTGLEDSAPTSLELRGPAHATRT
jgi:hypothetical protein